MRMRGGKKKQNYEIKEEKYTLLNGTLSPPPQ
jgi:hypothetical protein